MYRSVLLPALLALAACNAPTLADEVAETGSIDSELSSHVRYIVAFKGAQGPGRAALAAAGARVALELPSVNAAAVTLPARAVAALQANPALEYVEEDALRYPMAQTTPYGITLTQADQVWPTTQGGLKVCVIDSGAYSAHEDLSGISFTGYASGTGNWYEDGCGHGTHVTGTIAARNNTLGVIGMNVGPIAVHAVKVFGNDCSWTYSSTLVDAADRCRAAGAKVINMSLGGSFKSKTEENKFKALWNNDGIISVAAAGNNGNTQMSYPASYPIVISVAAVDANKALASFSQRNREVDIAAPGVAVLSTVPWNSTASITVGTSTYSGGVIDGSASTSSSGVNGTVVNGGLCDSTGSWSGQVVLCERGVISFAEKVANVENSGGAAAIIYNNVSGGFAGTLNGTSAIPALSLSQEDGQALVASALGQSGNVKSFTQNPGSGYEAWDGTSMATPHVAGAIALIWSAYPTKTPAQVRTAIEATAEDLGSGGRDNSFGHGLLRAKAALDYLGAN